MDKLKQVLSICSPDAVTWPKCLPSQRLQQLREEAAMGGGHQHIRVMRRASAVCDGLKKMQDSCSGQIDKIVEKQKNFFRSLPEDEVSESDGMFEDCQKSCGEREVVLLVNFGQSG
eukprot:3936065-Rhodomonas_salina.2